MQSCRKATSALLWMMVAAATGLAPSDALCQVSLDVLQHDGYGMVPIKRPQPNVLTVLATVNGRKLSLVVDTGWGQDGITVQSDSLAPSRLPTEEVKMFGTSASGANLTGFNKTRAEQVTLGNVELSEVPLFFGNVNFLHGDEIAKVGANGFIGAGFLNTCAAIIDLHNLRLYLRPPGKGHRAVIGPALLASGLSEAPLLSQCLVDVEINGFLAKMAVDTGAFLSGADLRVAPLIKARAFKSRVGATDAAGIHMKTQVALLHSFKIGGVSVRAPDLRMSTFDFYSKSGGKVIGLLGMDILGRNGTIIDFGAHKLYFYKLP